MADAYTSVAPSDPNFGNVYQSGCGLSILSLFLYGRKAIGLNMKTIGLGICLVWGYLCLLVGLVLADETCLECHDTNLGHSLHNGFACTDCHQGVSLNHFDSEQTLNPVDCTLCHADLALIYQTHGRLQVGSDPDMPKCWSCHGSHNIRARSDPQSTIHPSNLAGTCKNCHTDINLVRQHPVLRDSPLQAYENSVHGRATDAGRWDAALCTDCHAATGLDGRPNAHRILSVMQPDSSIFHFAIPNTCGQCHGAIADDYWAGIHGQLVQQKNWDAPVCTDCHGEHGILSTDDPRAPVSSIHLAEQTCTPCHQSAVLNQRYGIPGVQRIDSYHGLKSQAGDKTVANCASCHGAHKILPSSNPESSIHPGNVQNTCGQCHPRIARELAQAEIHGTGDGTLKGWPRFVQLLYLFLIVLTIALMLVHNFADWFRFVRLMRTQKMVRRLNQNEVFQHWVMMLSFMVLVVTGFSLRFGEAWWVRYLFGWEGGFEMRGLIHRIAGLFMLAISVWHVVYLFSQRGKEWLKDMRPDWEDAQHLWQNILFFTGRKNQPPAFKRFSYMEKVEYWALVWGCAVMIVTGIMLWVDNFLVHMVHLPKVFLEIASVIHYYEAWLAFLAILVWHIYGVVLKPGVYPMSPAWLTGWMPEDMYHHEHPAGPQIEEKEPRG